MLTSIPIQYMGNLHRLDVVESSRGLSSPGPYLVHAGCGKRCCALDMSGLVGRTVHLTPGQVHCTVPVLPDLPIHIALQLLCTRSWG